MRLLTESKKRHSSFPGEFDIFILGRQQQLGMTNTRKQRGQIMSRITGVLIDVYSIQACAQSGWFDQLLCFFNLYKNKVKI